MKVDPKHHPKIIGKRGANISKIRSDFDVQVQFPDKSEEDGDQIKIIGYEHQAKAAQEAIMQIVQELVRCLYIDQLNRAMFHLSSYSTWSMRGVDDSCVF